MPPNRNLVWVIALAPAMAASAAMTSGEPGIAAVRAATERFRGVDAAIAEGYVRDPMNRCDTAEMLGRPKNEGTTGVRYYRPDLLGITTLPYERVDGDGTHTDFLKPAILIYEPKADGGLELVAVENLVFEAAWKAAGNNQPPAYQHVPYDHLVDDPETPVDEAHLFAPHFSRRFWLYRENPNGMFARYNPKVSCGHHRWLDPAGRSDAS